MQAPPPPPLKALNAPPRMTKDARSDCRETNALRRLFGLFEIYVQLFVRKAAVGEELLRRHAERP